MSGVFSKDANLGCGRGRGEDVVSSKYVAFKK